MREILFKAKRMDNGEWVEGHYAFDECALIIQSLQYRIENGRPNFVGVYPVIPTTVCEYTGLKDKNGKRIFEGDKISHRWADWDHSPTQHIVRWENNSCGFEPFSDSEENCHHCGGGLVPDDCEVIGTVFDEGDGHSGTN